MGARRVQSYLLRRYDWSPIGDFFDFPDVDGWDSPEIFDPESMPVSPMEGVDIALLVGHASEAEPYL